jgi:hypothetical protein
MTKNVTIVWGTNSPLDESYLAAREIRLAYLQTKFLAGLTTDVAGIISDHTVIRDWLDQAAAEEDVAYVGTFANTYGLDIVSIAISDPA